MCSMSSTYPYLLVSHHSHLQREESLQLPLPLFRRWPNSNEQWQRQIQWKYKTFREHPQRAISEIWDIWFHIDKSSFSAFVSESSNIYNIVDIFNQTDSVKVFFTHSLSAAQYLTQLRYNLPSFASFCLNKPAHLMQDPAPDSLCPQSGPLPPNFVKRE